MLGPGCVVDSSEIAALVALPSRLPQDLMLPRPPKRNVWVDRDPVAEAKEKGACRDLIHR